MKKLYHIIRTDGTEEKLELESPDLRELIGAVDIEFVNLRDGTVMVVDEMGYETKAIIHSPGHIELRPVKARKPYNKKATALYWKICIPGTTHRIVGDVVIFRDDEE